MYSLETCPSLQASSHLTVLQYLICLQSGYREGLDVGKQRTLQQGFDAGQICSKSLDPLVQLSCCLSHSSGRLSYVGYAQGLATGYRFGAAQGAVKALQILDSRHPGLLPGSQQVPPLSMQHISAWPEC